MINLSDYNDFFLFLGGLLLIGGIIYFFFSRPLRGIFISDREISRLRATNQLSTIKISFPKISISVVLLIIIIGGFLLNQFLTWRMDSSGILGKLFSISINITKK